ncbi:hypothetical protein FOZ63_014968, partial [Perkinsus olseni]
LRGIVCDCIHDFETRSPPIRVETAHIRGLDNRIADLLSRAPLLTKYTPYAPSVIPPNPKVSQVAVTVGCGAVDSQCWLFGSSAGCLALPSFRDWLLSRRVFRAWAGQGGDDGEVADRACLFREWMLLCQHADPVCSGIIERACGGRFVEVPGLQYGYEVDSTGLVFRLRPPGSADEDGLCGPKRQLLVPKSLLHEFAVVFHEQCGHGGVTSTCSSMFQSMYACGVRAAAKKAVRGCLDCALTRDFCQRAQVRMGAVKMPSRVFQVVGVDLFGPLRRPQDRRQKQSQQPSSLGELDPEKAHILTVTDRLSGHTFFR